jgi:hypothetical protein
VQGKSLKSSRTLALYPEDHSVYRPKSKQVSVFENESFFRFHGLNSDNDWVRLAKLIPWSELERRYAQAFDSKLGNVGKPARMALGALIIKERYGFSDEATVQEQKMRLIIPTKKNRRVQREYDKYLYRLRHLIENAFLHRKRWRGIANSIRKKHLFLSRCCSNQVYRSMSKCTCINSCPHYLIEPSYRYLLCVVIFILPRLYPAVKPAGRRFRELFFDAPTACVM